MQEGNLIAVNLNTVVHGSISIGGSNLFPVCPRCPGQVILVLSSILCKCSSGSPSSMPWYILREGLNLSSSITLMNSSALANLQYVSGANIHDKNDVLHVYVNDNGYADQNKTLRAETDLSQRLSNSRDLTLFIDNENDPPVLILQEFVIVVQGGSAKLEGGHMEDFDYTDYLSSSSTAANTNYSLQVSCDVGVLKMSFAHTSCFVQYKPILNVTKPVIIVNVDARATSASFVANRYGVLMSGQKTCTSSTGLPINDCSRLPYMMFETTPIKDQLISYPSATLTLRIYKVGCIKDSCPIDCVDAGTTGTDKPTCCQQQCVTEGKVSVNIVSCQFTTSLTFDQTKSMDLSFPPIPVGQIYMTNSKESWLEFPLDISLIRAQVASDNGMLCLNLVPDSTINETVFFYSPDRQDGTVNPKQGDGWPFPPNAELILVRGRSYNCTGSGCSLDCSGGDGSNIYSDACQSTKSISRDTAPCVIEVEAGSGIGDANLFFSTDMITMNSLLDDMMFNLSSNFSNAQGTNKANISFALKDELAVYVTVADNGWYQPSELPNYIARTNVTIVSIPIKTDPLPVKMNPVYDEPWLQDRLNNGLLPAYVMLEDCGNRPVEDCENCDAECRTKLQVLPTVQIGESVKGLFTVEISSKLGTITIPKSLRSLLSFSKGSGYRDRIVRFDGYTNDIRNVIQGLVYHTLQDQSIQYKNQYIGKCSRPCFLADIGPPAFLNTKEVAGCEQSCSQYIFNRVNDFNKSINAAMEADSYVFLETLVITFEDNAVTGIGTKGFAQVLLYNFYTLAINDRPCIIFGDTVSDGCRQRCATSNLANKCSPVFNSVRDVVSFAGNPFDLLANITRNYLEDDQTAVRLGGLVTKPIDLYDSSRIECIDLLSAVLAQRGESFTLPTWVSDCPQLNVKISALNGEVSLNNRENLYIYVGGQSQFAQEIAFIGHPIDCNVAMRMISYKMGSNKANFNSNRGIETVTFQISDQGYSGGDQTGEFEGSSQTSFIVINIFIQPLNDPPIITLPRPTDPISFDEGTSPLLQSKAIPAGPLGLDVADVDAYECGSCTVKDGTFPVSQKSTCLSSVDPVTKLQGEWMDGSITVEVSVIFGRLSIVAQSEPGIIPLSDAMKTQLQFWEDPTCSEMLCHSYITAETCSNALQCTWNGLGCWCRKVNPGSHCKSLKFKGPSVAVEEAIRVLQYTPRPYFNYLTYEQQEALTVMASDKVWPDNSSSYEFYCGTPAANFDPTPLVKSIGISIRPINSNATVGFYPNSMNLGFEEPAICEGTRICYDDLAACVGIQQGNINGWTTQGLAGLSFYGWTGDAVSQEGEQHLYLHVITSSPTASVTQNVTGFSLGYEYTLRSWVSARNDRDRGTMLNVSLIENPMAQNESLTDFERAVWLQNWTVGLMKDTYTPGRVGYDTWVPCRAWCVLSVQQDRVNPGTASSPFAAFQPITFIAHSPSYAIQMWSTQTNGGNQMVFVDDLQLECTRIYMTEDTPHFLDNLEIVDPDITPYVLVWVKARANPNIYFDLEITALRGTFDLATPDDCQIMPPVNNPGDAFEPSIIMTDAERIDFGIRCGVSTWANKTIFRSACPDICLSCNPPVPFTWVGQGTPVSPCIRLPLFDVQFNLTTMVPAGAGESLKAQKIIPTSRVFMTGTVQNISDVLKNNIFYLGNSNFNTDNIGAETLRFRVNDRQNVEVPLPGGVIPSTESLKTLDVAVLAVNDPPVVGIQNPKLQIYEGDNPALSGISVSDVDINEVKCKDGVCSSKSGVLQLQFIATNGSFSVDPLLSVYSFTSLKNRDYGDPTRGIYSDPAVYECMWRRWCDDDTVTSTGQTLGLSYDSPCAIVPQYHTLAQCVNEKLPFCVFVRSILDPVTRGFTVCKDLLNRKAAEQGLTDVLTPTEVNTLLQFQSRLVFSATSKPIVFTSSKFLVLWSTESALGQALTDSSVLYQPDLYFNGNEQIVVKANDLGRTGIRFPCPVPTDLPTSLYFEHCNKSYPYVAQETKKEVAIDVLPINNKPYIIMHDTFGRPLAGTQTIQAQQNITMSLPYFQIVDVDFDPLKTKMSIEISVRSNGVLSYNASKVPNLDVFVAIGGSKVQALGTLQDINTLMMNLDYKSDPQMIGVESLLIQVDDQSPCVPYCFKGGNSSTLVKDASSGPVLLALEIFVSKPPTCQYATCSECINQLVEPCGWCPSSCGGAGKCRDALSFGGQPRYGYCEPLCIAGRCLLWNMCEFPPDRSWIRGAVGAPMLFVVIITFHLLFMWSRKMHGSLPIYILKTSKQLLADGRKLKLLPPETASNLQIFYLGVLVLLGAMIPSIVSYLMVQQPIRLALGEAEIFTLLTDSCSVFFTDKPQGPTGSEQVTLYAFITANGTGGISDVMTKIDTCANVQSLQVINSRPSASKYNGYKCHVVFEIPQPIDRTQIPALNIINTGQKSTTITQTPSLIFDLGSSSLNVEGTIIKLSLFNPRARLFRANVSTGLISIRNATFDQVQISTDSADVILSTSDDEKMQIQSVVSVQQSENKVCLISALPTVTTDSFSYNDKCDLSCQNVTTTVQLNRFELQNLGLSPTATVFKNITTVACMWSCNQYSSGTLLPYRKSAEPGLQVRYVELSSVTGEIQYSTISETRLPPFSGRSPLDNYYIYDGLDGNRTVGLSASGLDGLQSAFNPGGANRPQEDWFEINLEGPGAPMGNFVWVSDPRYLVFTRELLEILTFGIVVPSSTAVFVNFVPSPCPYFDSSAAPEQLPAGSVTFTGNLDTYGRSMLSSKYPGSARRLMQLNIPEELNANYIKQAYSILWTALGANELPSTSFLAYKEPGKPFVVFKTDPKTGDYSIVQESYSSRPMYMVFLVLSICIPILVSLFLVLFIVRLAAREIQEYRQMLLDNTVAQRRLLQSAHEDEGGEAANAAGGGFLADEEEIMKQTSFFYFVELQLFDPKESKSVQLIFLVTLFQVAFTCIVLLPILLLGVQINSAKNQFICPQASDPTKCRAKLSSYTVILFLFDAVLLGIFVGELIAHYTTIRMNKFRRVLRKLFYVAMLVAMSISLTYFCAVIIWICLGILFDTARFCPYVTAIAGLLAVVYRKYAKSSILKKRIIRAIDDKIAVVAPILSRGFNEELIKVLLKQKSARLRHKLGHSRIKILQKCMIAFIILALVDAFLLVCFASFTAVSTTLYGVINTGVIAIALACADVFLNRRLDKQIEFSRISDETEEIIREAREALKFVLRQVQIGSQMVKMLKELAEDPNYQKQLKEEEVDYKMHRDAAKKVIFTEKVTNYGARIGVEVDREDLSSLSDFKSISTSSEGSEEEQDDMLSVDLEKDMLIGEHDFPKKTELGWEDKVQAVFRDTGEEEEGEGDTLILLLEEDMDEATLREQLGKTLRCDPERIVCWEIDE
uniref:PKD/REJ-like domain-containing protein n=1 Tax=Hanusia phi TaxID=3032 RepID=A0A7S0F1K6_9CRYP